MKSAILILLMMVSPALAWQSQASKRVLVLYWYDKEYPWNVNFERTFRDILRSAQGAPLEYYSEYLESNRFPGENQSLLLRDYLRDKFAGRKIDVVVADSDASLDFLLKYSDELFPYAPMVFVAAKNPVGYDYPPERGLTGLINLSTHRMTVDLALRLHPNTKHVFVVTGTLDRDRRFETLAREQLKGYESRLDISYLTDYSPEDLVAKTKALPENSIILYVWQQAWNAQGQILESPEILSQIARSSTVPIYGVSTPYIGAGAIGGYLNTAAAIGTRTAEIVMRIANGARAKDIPVERAPAEAVFDWRQLRRWRISEDDLPPNSVIRFKEPNVWEQHSQFVIFAVTLIAIQTGLMSWLLIEYRRRRRAEELSRDLANIVESSNDAIIGTTLDGKILSWNSGAELMYGYTAAEMLGNHISALVPADRMDEFTERIEKRKAGHPINNFETVRLKKDGTLMDVSVSVSIIRDHKGRVVSAASITRDISERKRAELELQRLTTHVLNLQDDERRRIARELHDVTAQNMFVINMNLSRLQRASAEGSDGHDLLTESRMLCDQALQEIRTLSYLLHPPMLDEAGLVRALRWYVEGFTKRSGIHIELRSTGEIGRLPSEIETALFRIVQESLTNIRRHSGSSWAGISLDKEEDRVVLQIRDQGRGMQKPASTEADAGGTLGVGIAGMRQRLSQFGGILEIDTSDRGVVVTAKVPISNGVNDGSHFVSRRSQNSA